MQTKLTLRMDEDLIRTAKTEADRRGKSVSQIVGEFFDTLSTGRKSKNRLSPVTTSLVGAARGRRVSEEDYHRHLREKFS